LLIDHKGEIAVKSVVAQHKKKVNEKKKKWKKIIQKIEGSKKK